MELIAERFDGIAGDLMPVHGVLFEAVEGGEVEAATEPPDRILAVGIGDEETHVGVTSRHVGIARVNHERDPHGLPRFAGNLGTMGRSGGRELVSVHVGEGDTAFFDHGSFGENTGARVDGRAFS